MSNESVVGRTQCPKCLDTNQDNLICYSDGGQHCYACGFHKSGTGATSAFSPTCKQERTPAMELEPYFKNRGVSQATLDRYSVKAFVDNATGEASVGFPLVNQSGQFSTYHFRRLSTSTGSLTREFFYEKGSRVKCPLFGWQLVNKNTKVLVVCEGETDTLALAEQLQNRPDTVVVGAVGAGFGSKVGAWLKAKASSLKVVLAFDNDKPGREAQAQVVEFCRQAGKTLYKLVFEAKDVGDALAAGEDLVAAFDNASVASANPMKTSRQVADDVVEFVGSLRDNKVVRLGFSPTLDKAVKLTPGSLVAIIGEGGCGKSTLAEHILLECLNHKLWACMISAEMMAYEVALKLLSTIDATPYHNYDDLQTYSPEQLQHLHTRITSAIARFAIADDFGGTDLDGIEAMVLEQIAAGQPPAVVVVDHMLAISSELENTTLEATAKFLKSLAKNCNTCVVVICHTRKTPSQNKRTIYRPTMADEYGSGGLQKWANCVLGVAIDRPKRQLLVETIKVNRMGGSYADVTLELDNWQLRELESTKQELTKYEEDEDYEDDDAY